MTTFPSISARQIQKELFPEICGSLLAAIGIHSFALQAAFPMTGFSGIAALFYYLFQIPVGTVILLLNIPVACFCYKLLGKSFFFRSVRCLFFSSLTLDLIAPYFPVYTGDRFLAAICTGVFCGLGYAVIYMSGASTGGMDFITMSVKTKHPHLPLGKIIFLSDTIIVLLGGLILNDIDGIIYGIITSYLSSLVIDKLMYGMDAGKLALIVTEKGDDICQVIDQSSERGCTILTAYGGYSKSEKQVIMCACNNKQMYPLKNAVKNADPASFFIILESNEVIGEGFKTDESKSF
ncbi:MAG: YitT family protein [Lachnospiraceae bacterium]|nr:YitT family protein [Lachnospiraceae bacterium]